MQEKTERFEVHLGAAILKNLDKWRRKQPDLPSRTVAIRLLVERGLAGRTTIARQKGSRRKAAEMASREIDRSATRPWPTQNARGESVASLKDRENFATFAPARRKPEAEENRQTRSSMQASGCDAAIGLDYER
jgi:hypothetical protein